MTPPVAQIEALAQAFAVNALSQLKIDAGQRITYDTSGQLIGDFSATLTFRGLYGFRATKNRRTAMIYIGKTWNDRRILQHLDRRNKDGSPLGEGTKSKHREIRAAIDDGYALSLCLCEDDDFGTASLSCLEIALILAARDDFNRTFPGIDHWNYRIG